MGGLSTGGCANEIPISECSAEVNTSYAYDPWGAPRSVAGADAALAARNPLRYRGYCYDTHSGLYYLPARYYDPATARFLTADPAPPSAGDPLTLNRYAYCVGDPVNASDPTGAVTDVEYESWRHYYYDEPATAGDRQAAEQATRAVVLPLARARAASAVLAAELAAARAAAAAVTYETVESGMWGFSQPDATTLWIDGVSHATDVLWVGGAALAGASTGTCVTPAMLSGAPIAGLGLGGAMMTAAQTVGNLADVAGLGWSAIQVARGKGRMGDVAISALELAWIYPGSGTVKFWIVNPYLTSHGEPSPQ